MRRKHILLSPPRPLIGVLCALLGCLAWPSVGYLPAHAAMIPRCGDIAADETWHTGNQYLVTCPITILPGSTLTVEPGVTISFDGIADDYGMTVQGTLTVRGTPAQPILFTSQNRATGDWDGILVSSQERTSQVSHAIFEYAGMSALHVRDSALAITGALFRHNGTAGFITGAVLFEDSDGQVANSIFHSNSMYDLYLSGSSPAVLNSVFYGPLGETPVQDARYGIMLNRRASPTIVNSVFAHLQAGLLYQDTAGAGTVDVIEFYNAYWNNIIDTNGGPPRFREGILQVDPRFADVAAGDFHLSPASPLIDAGDSRIADPDGSRADIGAFGGGSISAPFPLAPPDAIPWDGRVQVRMTPALGAEGYRVYYGTEAGVYPEMVDFGPELEGQIAGLTNGTTYYFTARSYTGTLESVALTDTWAIPEHGTYLTSSIAGDVHLTADRSPYILQPSSGQEIGLGNLTVDPGVTVRLGKRTCLVVGSLVATGTSSEARDTRFVSSYGQVGDGGDCVPGIWVQGDFYTRYVTFEGLDTAVTFSLTRGALGFITESTFRNNHVAVYAQMAQVVLSYNLFEENFIGVYQGHLGDIAALSNTFVANPGHDRGTNVGVLRGFQQGHLAIKNNLIVSNRYNAGIYVEAEQTVAEIAYNNLWGNRQDYDGDAAPGEGALAVDPLFVAPELHDFHLQATSPVIGKGEHGVDMGAFPFNPPPASVETSIDPALGGILNPPDALIRVPAGAVAQLGNVRFVTSDKPPGQPPVMDHGVLFRLEAESGTEQVTTLQMPATLVVHLDEVVPGAAYALYRFDSASEAWVPLADSEFDAGTQTLTATSRDLGWFATGQQRQLFLPAAGR